MEASNGNDKMPPATAAATVTAAAESAGSYQPPVAVAATAAVASSPPAAVVIPIPAGGAAPSPAAVANPSLASGAAPSPPVSSAAPVALPSAAGTAPVPVGASPAVMSPAVALAAPLVTSVAGAAPAGQVSFGHASLSVALPGVAGVMKKKRGRPRKYALDGSVLMPLNPTPISASMPAGEYPAAAAAAAAMKRGRWRPAGYLSKHQPRIEFESLGEMVACSAGANFTPHVITVPAGEDVTTKIMSFSQQGPRAICILSANGSISNVTLRQPDSSGGTLTYEGRFELLSLSGSFMPSDNGATRSRSGGMSVSLAGPDGRVVGGAVAGLLVAAGPVQVVVGSFLPSYQMEQKTKKPRLEPASASTPTSAIPASSPEREETYGSGQGQRGSSTPKPHFSASSFRGENWSASIHSVPDTRTQNSAPDARNSTTDINLSLPGG